MNRRDFLKSVGAGAASLAMSNCHGVGGTASDRAAGRKPNILMILVDDLGYGDLACYGSKDMRTPHVDRLMSQGMRFDNFYANCPVCSPTRAALLTGRYPDLVGVPGVIRTHIKDNWGFLSPHDVLIPTVLKNADYHTAIVGKWHLGLELQNKPNFRGFDFFHGFLGDMMDDYYNHRRFGRNYMRRNELEIDPKGHATDLFTQWSVEYLRDRSRREKPFFLYLAYNAPHTPIQPPPEWVEKVKKREQNISEKRAKLVGFIEHLDDGIGKVLAALQETGLDQNTLVVFTSDNGGLLRVGANNGPLRAGKQDMYEGGIKVPMCAVWPGRIKAGARSDRVALTMDLYPTFCEAAGAKFDHEIDGRSILETLLGKSQPPEEDRFLFWMRREGNRYGGQDYYAARYGDFKLVHNSPFEPLELYNLKEDPKEERPLSNKHPMYRKLFTALRNHISQAGAIPWQKYPVEIDRIR